MSPALMLAIALRLPSAIATGVSPRKHVRPSITASTSASTIPARCAVPTKPKFRARVIPFVASSR